MKTKSRNRVTNNGSRVINDTGGVGERMIMERDQTQHAIQQLVMHQLMTRTELLGGGLDRKHKINRDCGYPTNVSVENYAEMYAREGIATRLVHLKPDESWKDDPEVLESSDPDVNTQFEKDWLALEKRRNLNSMMHRLDRLCGIGRFGILLLGINDSKVLIEPVDGVIFDPESDDEITPVPGKKPKNTQSAPLIKAAKRKLLYVKPIAEEYVDIDSFDTDPKSPRYGLPVIYSIKFSSMNSNRTRAGETKLRSQKVHWTRVIHVADNLESDEVFGTSRMQYGYNRLFDLRKILGGSGEMFWRGGFPGINFKMDPASKGARPLTKDEKKALKREVLKYMEGLQRFIATEGMSVDSISPTVADPTNHFEMNLKALAISEGCPYRVFTGTEEGKLAGGQDSRAWNTRMNRRREKFCTPYIIRQVVDRLVQMQVLTPPANGEYFVKWKDLNTATESEVSTIGQQRASALSTYVSSGADAVIPPPQFLSHILGLSDDVVEIIQEAVDEWVVDLASKREDEQQMKKDDQKIKAAAAKGRNFPPPGRSRAAPPKKAFGRR